MSKKYILALSVLMMTGCGVMSPSKTETAFPSTLAIDGVLPPAQVTVQPSDQPAPIVNVTVPTQLPPSVTVQSDIDLTAFRELMSGYVSHEYYYDDQKGVAALEGRIAALEASTTSEPIGATTGLPASCEKPMEYFLAVDATPTTTPKKNVYLLKQIGIYQHMLKECIQGDSDGH